MPQALLRASWKITAIVPRHCPTRIVCPSNKDNDDQKNVIVPTPPSRQSQLRGCGRIFKHHLKLERRQNLPSFAFTMSSLGPCRQPSCCTSHNWTNGETNFCHYLCSSCTQTIVQNIMEHKRAYWPSCIPVRLIFTVLLVHTENSAYLLLKVVRFFVDSNDVLITDACLMPILYGLCHQNTNSSYIVFVTHLNSLIPTMTGFSPLRRRSGRSRLISPNPCGSSAFQDEEWSCPPASLSSKATHGER